MSLELDILRILQIMVVILGTVVVYFATRSYQKTKSKSMIFLSLGFLFVTVGAVAAGILFEFFSPDLVAAEDVQAASQVFGFFLIVYSIIGVRD